MFIVPILFVRRTHHWGTKIRKVKLMGAVNRVETSRTPCECSRGEYVFYACEADRWLYVENPHEKWFEMHISCETCARLFRQHKLTVFSQNDDPSYWKLTIPEPDRIPIHS